ncbi:MAG: hypothetical protein KKE89_06925 [Actinobacteria bacterium]|jgi:hypothetical protein|nr:hypothetical protein [Actinomycetota bacterium]
MKTKRSVAAVLLCALLASCTGSAPSEPALPSVEEAKGLPAQVLDDARDIAGQLDQREADLEAAIP